ncbi:uncharacterized protein [Watersipora subatra]|uniref:uncharacterized protein n=1 Tax=Watersipora subatra TaxID=2589382 RepID=UPI00355B542C
MAAREAKIVEELRNNLICHICEEQNELRLLPCQNTVCLACLERIASTASEKRQSPTCPYCRKELKLSPSAYPICRLAADIERELDTLSAVIEESNFHNELMCETDGCSRPIDWHCYGCQSFLCTRCSFKPSCTNPESTHQLVEFVKLKEESVRQFEEWKTKKEIEINALESARTQIASEMQQEIAGASCETVADIHVKHEQLKTSHQILSLKTLEEGERAVLDYYTAGISQVSDTEYIRLVHQMTVAIQSSTKAVIVCCQVITNKPCYTVKEASNGQLMVGRNGGFDILDKDGRLVRCIAVPNSQVLSVQEYKGKVYTLCVDFPPSSKRRVIIFSGSSYKRIRSWPVPDYKYVSQLTVSNDKVYVSDTESCRLCVYPVGYQYSKIFFLIRPPTYITNLEFRAPEYLASCPGDSIAISDPKANKVQMRCLKDGTEKWTSSAVSNPVGICCGVRQDMWVWSESSKSLYRLSSHSGKVKEELTHPKFAEFSVGKDMNDMCLTADGGILWAAARTLGLMKFTVEYK